MLRKLLLLVTLMVFLEGCSSVKSIYARYSYDFHKYENTERIHYDTGMEELARLAKEYLDKSEKAVIKAEYVPFRNMMGIEVYIFGDYERYSAFSNTNGGRASSSMNDIFISPKLLKDNDSLPGILEHELSHIHLRQYVGSWKYVHGIPAWYKEGLAVTTSGGAGAEGITKQEAARLMITGHHFDPEEGGSIFSQKHAHNYGLKPHMFYYQAGLFVSFLKEFNESAFEKSYLGLISGEEFENIWEKYYSQSITALWDEFISRIKHNYQINLTQKAPLRSVFCTPVMARDIC